MREGILAAALGASLLTMSAGTATAVPTVVFEDNFDSEAGGLNTMLDNFTILQGSVDVIGCSGTGLCVDLDGSSGRTPPTIIQTAAFNFLAGESYNLSFLISTSSTSLESFRVSIGDLFDQTYSGYAPGLNPTESFTVAADTSAALRFELLETNNNFGPYLDNVSLVRTADPDPDPDPVPGPGAIALLGLGVLGIGLRRRR